jgi:hypothetical protein
VWTVLLLFKVGLKPCGQSGALLSSLENILRVCILIKDNGVLVWKVDLEVYNIRLFLVHLIGEETPTCFCCRDITHIKVLLDLVHLLPKTQWPGKRSFTGRNLGLKSVGTLHLPPNHVI